jgi:formate/nitrite transporter FocA (FNT family)
MFFLPMGMILGAQVTIGNLITNLVVVTLGNIVGGAIIIPFIYHNCYLKRDNKLKTTN